MSSHREAPEISKDPVADSTDVYAFVSPDRPDTVTLIANYIPLQSPAGGPNFYEFGDDVLYKIHISNAGKSQSDLAFGFRFHTKFTTPDSFLYNTGPITSLNSPSWNSKQFYTVTRWDHHGHRVIAEHLACPPCNVGVASTPDYEHNLGAPGRARHRQRHQGLRRTALRAVLRRPRRDLRPRRPAPVPAPQRVPQDGRRARRQRHQPPERAHDRHPDPDLAR